MAPKYMAGPTASSSFKRKKLAIRKKHVSKKPATQVNRRLPAAEARLAEEPFSLKKFIDQVWRIGGYTKPTESPGSLRVFEGCAGAGTITHVLKAMEFSVKGAAVEKNPSAALFLAKNHAESCSCVFVDMAEVAKAASPDSDGKACCYLHGTRCSLPPPQDSIYSSGFACPPYSKQNPRRFQRDCIQHPHPIHNVSLEATVDQICTRKPKIAILENSYGMKAARGGGNSEPATNAVADLFESRFAPGTVAMVEGTAHPLSTARPRLFWYVSEDGGEPAAALKREFEVLRFKTLRELPMHHAKFFLAGAGVEPGSAGVEPSSAGRGAMQPGSAGVEAGSAGVEAGSAGVRPGSDDGEPGSARLEFANISMEKLGASVAGAAREADYARAYAKALQKAYESGRLPAHTPAPPRSSRLSATCSALQGVTAWMRAQVDVYSLIAAAKKGDCQLGHQYRIADVSQSVNRGVVTTRGQLPTITTSTTWFNFEENEFIKPQALMAVHGFDLGELDFTALTDQDLARLAGNSMACSLVVLVLTPALRALGYLQYSQ
jgi:hypothetical protein